MCPAHELYLVGISLAYTQVYSSSYSVITITHDNEFWNIPIT